MIKVIILSVISLAYAAGINLDGQICNACKRDAAAAKKCVDQKRCRANLVDCMLLPTFGRCCPECEEELEEAVENCFECIVSAAGCVLTTGAEYVGCFWHPNNFWKCAGNCLENGYELHFLPFFPPECKDIQSSYKTVSCPRANYCCKPCVKAHDKIANCVINNIVLPLFSNQGQCPVSCNSRRLRESDATISLPGKDEKAEEDVPDFVFDCSHELSARFVIGEDPMELTDAFTECIQNKAMDVKLAEDEGA